MIVKLASLHATQTNVDQRRGITLRLVKVTTIGATPLFSQATAITEDTTVSQLVV